MVKPIKEYLLEVLDAETITDITEHGCSGGIGGFIYYSETAEFHDEYEYEIWEMLETDASDYDISIMEFISGLNGGVKVSNMQEFKNLLCWYAVERICNEIEAEKARKAFENEGK